MAEIDKTVERVPAPPNVDKLKPGEKKYQYERRLDQHARNLKSRYPPMNIEPMPHVRNRTHKWMTAEDRFLRKQWLNDQQLTAVEAGRDRRMGFQKNWFRRMFELPWNKLYEPMAKQIGPQYAAYVRYAVPKVMMGYITIVTIYYQICYNPKTWEKNHGYWMIAGKLPVFPGDKPEEFPQEITNFFDGGFSKRTVFKD